MIRFFRLFFPAEVDFFTPMREMFGLILRGAEVYGEATGKEFLSDEEKDRLLVSLKKLEVAGDDIVKKVSANLKRTFTPPFSQIELRRMFERLDNTLDLLDESAKIIIHSGYRVGFPPFVAEQLDVFKKGLAEAAKIADLLKEPRGNADLLAALVASVGEMEKEGDRIYWRRKKELSTAINAAAQDNRLSDYRRAVMDDQILDLMERLIDTLTDIMKVAEGMVIEHA